MVKRITGYCCELCFSLNIGDKLRPRLLRNLTPGEIQVLITTQQTQAMHEELSLRVSNLCVSYNSDYDISNHEIRTKALHFTVCKVNGSPLMNVGN